jgi:phage FluMu protein Com
MRPKLWLAIASLTALVALVGQGIYIYTQGTCGQYPIFGPDCSKLLSEAETQKFLQSKQSAVEALTQINPEQITITASAEPRCSGKSIIFITHPSENDCDAINAIVRQDFSDIPYKLINN